MYAASARSPRRSAVAVGASGAGAMYSMISLPDHESRYGWQHNMPRCASAVLDAVSRGCGNHLHGLEFVRSRGGIMASATRDARTAADRQIIGDVFTSDSAYQLLLRLCDECGNRFAGSASERRAADVIAET